MLLNLGALVRGATPMGSENNVELCFLQIYDPDGVG